MENIICLKKNSAILRSKENIAAFKFNNKKKATLNDAAFKCNYKFNLFMQTI
jgi:hypothetical protein